MKKFSLVFALSLVSMVATANDCTYSLNNTVINIEGWIEDVAQATTSVLESHGYVEAKEGEVPALNLSVQYQQVNGGFLNKAEVGFSILNSTGAEVLRIKPSRASCLNELCSIFDFRAAAGKVLKTLNSQLKNCKN